MFESIEKVFLSGLGAVALSQKMAEEFVKDMKDRYKLSEDEGKAFLDRMQCLAKESRQRMTELAEQEVKRVVDKVGLVPRSDYESLLKRVEELEKRLSAE